MGWHSCHASLTMLDLLSEKDGEEICPLLQELMLYTIIIIFPEFSDNHNICCNMQTRELLRSCFVRFFDLLLYIHSQKLR